MEPPDRGETTPVFHHCDQNRSALLKMIKRLFDIVSSLIGLLFFLPVFLITSLLVLLGSGRPIFFKQRRVGRGGQDFLILKFRSMSDEKRAEAGQFDAGSCSRVTPIGKFLRRTKLDELPQIWNVLKGEMSVVGPRPEIRKWVEAYPNRWQEVLTVRPGITDPASIRFRNEEALLAEASDPEAEYREVILPQKLALYEEYVANASFFGDLALIFKTILVVIRK
jgi:lipopolysaccharide/colanic/teichoic acid biosynthesis glycosyltransferase